MLALVSFVAMALKTWVTSKIGPAQGSVRRSECLPPALYPDWVLHICIYVVSQPPPPFFVYHETRVSFALTYFSSIPSCESRPVSFVHIILLLHPPCPITSRRTRWRLHQSLYGLTYTTLRIATDSTLLQMACSWPSFAEVWHTASQCRGRHGAVYLSVSSSA